MALNLKASIFIVLAIISTILYYNAYIANQPCRHKLASLKESDKIQLQKAMIDRLMSSLAIKTISNFNSQNKTNFIQYIEFIRKGIRSLMKITIFQFLSKNINFGLFIISKNFQQSKSIHTLNST